jgi:hypothetical protein
MSGAAPDLIAGYLEELYAGLRVPADEAELIAAEAEDHLRETAAAGLAIGMTELEAQRAAISGFGPVRAVIRAHRRGVVTAAATAMAAWKLAALLATTVGAGGLAGMGIFQYLMRSAPDGAGPVPTVMVVYAALAAGGLVLLAARRLTGHSRPSWDPLPPGITAGCFLLASALLGIFGFPLRSTPAPLRGPAGPCSYVCSFSSGPAVSPDPGSRLGPVLMVLAVYAILAAGGLVSLAVRRLTGHGGPGRDPLPPGTTAGCFLLASAPLLALIVSGVTVPIAPAMSETWTTPLSDGSVSAAPLVAGAVVAGCLAVAAGYGLQAVLRRPRRMFVTGTPGRVAGRADRDGAGRAYA